MLARSVSLAALALALTSAALGVRRGAFVVSLGIAALTMRVPDALEPVFLLLFFGMAVLVSRVPGDLALVATFANWITFGLLLGPLWAIGSGWWRSDRMAPLPGYRTALDPRVPVRSGGPDVWWILLDGHGRDDVLSEKYGVRDGFSEWLASRGFYVASDARANYAQTAFSIASTLNLEPVESLLADRDPGSHRRLPVGRLARDSRVAHLFRRQGYRVVAYPSEYSLTEPRGADERRAPPVLIQEFDLTLFTMSSVPVISRALTGNRALLPHALRRRALSWTLRDLARGDRDDGPQLVLAHLVAPHPPFVFARDGSPRPSLAEASLNDGSHWKEAGAETGEDYVDGYAQQVEWLHGQLKIAIDGILSTSRTPPVILIQGDHGPGADLDWNSVEGTDVRERLSILSAYRLPSGTDRLYPSITPVNSFRVVLSELFGADLPLLPDRSLYQTWERPHDGVDVTDRLGPPR